MDLHELSKQIKTEDFQNSFKKVIPCKTRNILGEMSVVEIENRLNKIFADTINAREEIEWELYRIYYIAAWYKLYGSLNLPVELSIYEIATGDTVYVPQALDIYSGNRGKYVTLNLNKELSASFRSKTENMGADVRIIEDNGINVLNYYAENTFDVVAFQHAVNDIVQTIVADIEGIDTVRSNWWATEPQMLRAVFRNYQAGKLKDVACQKFIDIIKVCCKSLKDGGYLIFNNCTFNADYAAGDYSMEFHSLYIDIAREWIAEANLGLEELEIQGYQSKWWMILKKNF